MNVDFHFHSCLTKGIPFDYDFFREAVARAREVDLQAIIITDHFDNAAFETIFPTLDAHHSYNGRYYLIDGVRFYPGMEVEIQEGLHLLVAGSREDVLTLFERLRDHRTAESYAPVSEFFARQAGLDLLNIVAHPRRPRRELERIDAGAFARFDAFDLNAKDLWRYGAEMRVAVEELAATHRRPLVAGSDTHHFRQLGSLYNQFHEPFESIAELRGLIHAGRYTLHVRPELPDWVELAQQTKKAIKQERYGLRSSKYD